MAVNPLQTHTQGDTYELGIYVGLQGYSGTTAVDLVNFNAEFHPEFWSQTSFLKLINEYNF